MDPGRRPARFRLSRTDHIPKAVRIFERLQQQHGAAQLEDRMRIRADRPGGLMRLCEGFGFPVVKTQHAARVEDLDGIHQRQDRQQVIFLPSALSLPIERVRDADKGPLFPQAADRFSGREPGRNLLPDEGRQDLPRVVMISSPTRMRFGSSACAASAPRIEL